MLNQSITLPPAAVLETAAHTLAEHARAAGNAPHEQALNKALLQALRGTTPLAVAGGVLIESRTNPGVILPGKPPERLWLPGSGCGSHLLARGLARPAH